MLKSHFKIHTDVKYGDELAKEELEDEAEVEQKLERISITDISVTRLKKSQVCLRLSFLGQTADGDGYAYLKASLNNMGLTCIDIIKCFKHLQFLDLSSNELELKNLQPVTELPYLIFLQVDKNKLVSAALAKMPYLQVMVMNENNISTVEDVFQPELSTLELGFNQLKEIKFLNKMTEMKCLDFRNNKILNIGVLDFPKLDSLYLAYNKITSLVGIERLVNLRILHVRGNPIRLLDGFDKELVKLNYINLRYTKVSTMIQIKKLRVLPALETLVVKGCPIMGGTGEEADTADAEEDAEVRTEILAALPRLKRLNKEIVTPEEKQEAKALMMQWLEDGEHDEEEIEPETQPEEVMEAGP